VSVLGLRGQAQSDERLERRATTLLDLFFSGSASQIQGHLHDAFSWFGRAIAPRDLDAARLSRLTCFNPIRPRALPLAITRAWSERGDEIVPRGARALVLVDLVPRGGGAFVTVAVAFAGLDADARVLAVFDAAAIVPHLRAI